MANMIRVKFIYNNGTLTPVPGKVSGRFYGYLSAPADLDIDERDFDRRFQRLDVPPPPATVTDDDPPPPPAPDDLTQLPGVGKKLAETLNEHGIMTYEDVIAHADAIMTILNVSEEKAEAILDAADAKVAGDAE